MHTNLVNVSKHIDLGDILHSEHDMCVINNGHL